MAVTARLVVREHHRGSLLRQYVDDALGGARKLGAHERLGPIVRALTRHARVAVAEHHQPRHPEDVTRCLELALAERTDVVAWPKQIGGAHLAEVTASAG